MRSHCDTDGHFVCLVVKVNNIFLIVVNIYGFNSKSDNDQLLDSLDLASWLLKFPDAYLLLGGDFTSQIVRYTPGARWFLTIMYRLLACL